MSFNDVYASTHGVRFKNTLRFLKESIPAPVNVLDLGIENPFSGVMRSEGYDITNTEKGIDLDDDFEVVKGGKYQVVTAFEIFEHLVAPYNLLKEIKAEHLVASVPLHLWFAKAYWNKNDPWDRHYHEFEPRQFDMLLDKAGWKIVNSEKWKSPVGKIGLRPILRRFTDRYYIVHCIRK